MNIEMKNVQTNFEVINMSKKKSKHNPQAESIKAVYGEPKAKKHDPKDFII